MSKLHTGFNKRLTSFNYTIVLPCTHTHSVSHLHVHPEDAFDAFPSPGNTSDTPDKRIPSMLWVCRGSKTPHRRGWIGDGDLLCVCFMSAREQQSPHQLYRAHLLLCVAKLCSRSANLLGNIRLHGEHKLNTAETG